MTGLTRTASTRARFSSATSRRRRQAIELRARNRLPLPSPLPLLRVRPLDLRLLELPPRRNPPIHCLAPLLVPRIIVQPSAAPVCAQVLHLLLRDGLDAAPHGVPGVRVALGGGELLGDLGPPVAEAVALAEAARVPVADGEEGGFFAGCEALAVVAAGRVRAVDELEWGVGRCCRGRCCG
ncbi:hypothetical protein KEM55_005595 [Ascosphaera atra]|nr:hypothetical protein KEM55_005595 [Ascosphaera atra]